MGVSGSEINLIDHEAQGIWSRLAKQVILVPDVHVLHVHLNTIE